MLHEYACLNQNLCNAKLLRFFIVPSVFFVFFTHDNCNVLQYTIYDKSN